MHQRECPYCGNKVGVHVSRCAFCREALPPIPHLRRAPAGNTGPGSADVRHGLLCMLLAAVIMYFAGGYSPLTIPIAVLPALSTYLSPMLFLSGLGLTVYGYYRQHRARLA
jgi:hypothetical protein